MTARESSVSLGALSLEGALIRQPSIYYGGSGVTETPSGGRGGKRKPSNSDDSDYDVDGFKDGSGCVSSKDDRKKPPMDKEQFGNSSDSAPRPQPEPLPDLGKEREQPHDEQPRKPKHSKRLVPSLNEQPHDEAGEPDERSDVLPDMNQSSAPLIDYLMREGPQVNATEKAMRSLDAESDTQDHVSTVDFISFFDAPPTNVLQLGMLEENRPLIYTGAQHLEHRSIHSGIPHGHQENGLPTMPHNFDLNYLPQTGSHHGTQSPEFDVLDSFWLGADDDSFEFKLIEGKGKEKKVRWPPSFIHFTPCWNIF